MQNITIRHTRYGPTKRTRYHAVAVSITNHGSVDNEVSFTVAKNIEK